MKLLEQCQLYAFVDTAWLRGRSPEELTRKLCAGGADLVQLRAKGWVPEEIRRLAERLLPITESAGVGLVVNDHPQVAADVGAPLCHLGQEDLRGFRHSSTNLVATSGSRLRSRPPLVGADSSRRLRFGLSSHAPDEAARAVAVGAAYVGVGPVFPTATKPAAKPVTLAYVRWAAENLRLPWFAIGGITLENLESVLAAGARRIAVVSAILDAADVAGACQRFKERLVSAPS